MSLKTAVDLARLLECSPQQLAFWTQIARPEERYTTFEISKKNGGTRTIEAPAPVLRVLQTKLLQVLNAVYEPRAPVHGFVNGRSILTNASQHARRAWVLNIDLAEFFPTIHFGRVRGIFRAKPFNLPDEVAIVVARLACARGRLPQGAPTSPIISNIVCAKMDGELRRFAKEQGAVYTRYADDITFSVRRRGFPQAIAAVQEPEPGTFTTLLSQSLTSIITANGFEINDAKLRIQPWKRSQRVTGLVVNRGPNVPRRFVRRTRAMLHAWERYGLSAAQTQFQLKYTGQCRNKERVPSFERRVRGNISYIGQIKGRDDSVYVRLLSKWQRLTGVVSPGGVLNMASSPTQRDVFICHASEDKKTVVSPLVAALQDVGVTVWFDKSEIKWGDSITGKINEGLAMSRYVIVVISSNFLRKQWAQKELNAALNREITNGTTCVLPLMVGSPEEITELNEKLPLQADKLHLVWTAIGPGPIVDELNKLLAASP